MNLTEYNQQIRTAKLPLLIDVWAPWCAPCKLTKPILEKLAQEYAGRVELVLLNADEAPKVVEGLRILGVPTLLAYQGGRETTRLTGMQNEAQYRAVFAALATGQAVSVPMAAFDRFLRLGAGVLLALVGLATHSLLLAAAGGLVAFFGVYDRCPIWAALSARWRAWSGRENP
jgi:thioredoxin